MVLIMLEGFGFKLQLILPFFRIFLCSFLESLEWNFGSSLIRFASFNLFQTFTSSSFSLKYYNNLLHFLLFFFQKATYSNKLLNLVTKHMSNSDLIIEVIPFPPFSSSSCSFFWVMYD